MIPVTHEARIIEIEDLPSALAAMGDMDRSRTAAAERLVRERERAVRIEGVGPDERDRIEREARGAGVELFPGVPDRSGRATVVLAGPGPALRRLAAALGDGPDGSGTSLRAALQGAGAGKLSIEFAGGERMELTGPCRVMGVLNVTPDSFSDGGRFEQPESAVEAACRMAEEGADLVDVGGESTRPGADPVSVDEEIRRVVPVVEGIRRRLAVRVSVDTRKAEVARAALDAGADLVNDVSALADPAMLPLLAKRGAPVVLMHMRGTPRTMQSDTSYVDVVSSVTAFLRRSVEKCVAAGLGDDKIVVDPGIGFGKSAEGNLEILRQLPSLQTLGRPILIGASRKSFIGAVLDLPVTERIEGSLAVAALAAWRGAHVVRVHDVAATVRVVRMVDAIRRA